MSGEQQATTDGRAGERMTADERRRAVLGALDAEEWRDTDEVWHRAEGCTFNSTAMELRLLLRDGLAARSTAAAAKVENGGSRPWVLAVWRLTPAGLDERERLKGAGA